MLDAKGASQDSVDGGCSSCEAACVGGDDILCGVKGASGNDDGVVTVAALVMRSAQAVTEANVSAAVAMTEAAAAVLVVKMVLVALALEAVSAAILVLWAREVTLVSEAAVVPKVRALMATEFMMVVANVAEPTAQSMTTAAIVYRG